MRSFTPAHGELPVKKNRSYAPSAWTRTKFGKPEVPMTWHHVIPHAAMRACWNALASHQAESPRAKVALQIYMRLLGFPHGETKTLIKEMEAGSLPVESQDRIEAAVTYPPWNIVEGPHNRAKDDDPGSRFDIYAAGLTAIELARHEKLKVLDVALRTFNDATQSVEKIDERVFDAVAHQMTLVERTLKSCTKPIEFRETMWRMIEPPGQFNIIPAAAQWRKKRLPKPGTPMQRT